MYETIIDALRRGAADEALAAARQTVAAHPEDGEAHRMLSAALRLSGQQPEALAAIDRAIALSPEDANLHLERAGLLLRERKLDEAQSALAQTTGLDPNLFLAYTVQAQLALGQGNLDEAERLARTAARIAPDHPQVSALEGTIALRRGDSERALSILGAASRRHPDEPVLRHSLGFAYLAQGHLAFAEQAFRGLREAQPDSLPLRTLIADLMRRQGRPGEAVDEITAVLHSHNATPGLRRLLGEMELDAGRHEAARDRLLALLREQPDDRRTMLALAEAWRRLDAADEARATFDALLAEHPQVEDLWRARLLFDAFGSPAAADVVARWKVAAPTSIRALEAALSVYDAAGDSELAEVTARRIVELEPGHSRAELRIIDALLARDGEAAVGYVESMLATTDDEQVKRNLRQLLGSTFDAAGQPGAAAATWAEVHAEVVTQRLPRPQPSAPRSDWPQMAVADPRARSPLLLWGPPGSLVEKVAGTLDLAGAPLRGDRFGASPPNDLFQRYRTIEELADGSADPAALVAEWRATLPARGIADGQVFDWLLWWDNAALIALREHLPEAVLAIVLRDPRDMLLDWLAFGAPAPLALETPEAGAQWLAKVLEQVADLHEQELFPHRIIRLDGVESNPEGIARVTSDALQVGIRPALPGQIGNSRLPAGHWQKYVDALGGAFALLTPVAVRLGYADA